MPDYGLRPPSYRLPEETRIGRVRLQVSDLARSLQYYETILGMRVIERSSSHAALGAHGDETVFLELREKKGVRPVARRGLLGLYHFAILLPDRPSLGRFLRHLANLNVPAGMSDHLVSEAVYLQDPDNLGIEVYRDRPREQWTHSDRQLDMATEPLDAMEVVASAGNEEWSGMPAGTRIGHVHLHIGELERTEVFYHKALGFDKMVWSYPGALFFAAGGYHHHLGTNTWARGAPSASDDDARLLEWEIVLPGESDVQAASSSLGSAGFTVSGGLVTDPWGIALRLRT